MQGYGEFTPDEIRPRNPPKNHFFLGKFSKRRETEKIHMTETRLCSLIKGNMLGFCLKKAV